MKNIATAFIKAQSEMSAPKKDNSNPFFKSKYADLNSVLEAVMKPLNNNGIAVLQPTVCIDGKNYVKTILLHESGETLESFTEILYAKVNDAQGQGSGITYARRYGLQSLCGVGAEDDDGNKASAPVKVDVLRLKNKMETATTIEELGTGYTGVSTGFEQAFKVSIPFIISPAFIDTFVDSNDEISGNLFTELAGANSLKFVYKFEAGTDNSSVIFSTDNGNISAFINNGDVGFYDQYRNTASTPEYSITDIVFTDANANVVDEMIKNATTSVAIEVNSANGRFVNSSTKANVWVYEVPEDFADVKNNSNTLFTNFDVSYVLQTEGVAATSNNNIVDLVVTYVDANTLTIEFDYSPPNADKRYIIVVETSDVSEVNMVDSDGMTMLADYNTFAYSVDLSEIYSSTNGILVNEHSSNDLNRSFTDYKGWIEDGVLFTNEFTIQSTGGYSSELDIALSSVDCKIEVVNASDSSRNFTLEEFTLTPPNEDTGRTFKLPTSDPKNYLYITEDTVAVGSTTYTIKYATKLRWETWFSQANADPSITSTAYFKVSNSGFKLNFRWHKRLNISVRILIQSVSENQQVIFCISH